MSVYVMGGVWELDLDHRQKFVLLALADHADHNGGSVRPSVALIAWKTGYSKRQVQRIIRDLEEAGILVRTSDGIGGRGHATHYRIDLTKGVKLSPFRASEKGDISDIKGDISDIKGDIYDLKGDIAMSPEPSRTVKEPSVISSTPRARSADEYLELLGPEKVNDLADTLTEMSRTIGGIGWVRNTLRELATEVPGLSRDQLRVGLNLGLDRLERQMTTDNGHIRNPPGLARYVFQRALEEQSE